MRLRPLNATCSPFLLLANLGSYIFRAILDPPPSLRLRRRHIARKTGMVAERASWVTSTCEAY